MHRIEGKQGNAVRWELYDLGNDPGESRDQGEMEPERAAKMRGALEIWLGSVTASLRGDDY